MTGSCQHNSGDGFLTVGLAIVIGVGLFLAPGTQIALGQRATSPNSNYQTPSNRVDNTASSTYRPVNTQLYITGQVTGLRSFRGEVGYRATNELNTVVPSAAIRGFQRRSVGLPDVVAGRTYLPHAYFDRSLTVWSAGGILAGRADPGGDVIRSSRGTPGPSAQVPTGAKPQYYDPAGIYSQAFPLVARPKLPTVPSLKTRPPTITAEEIAEFARIVQESPVDEVLYKLAKPSEQAKLAAELAKLVPRKFEVDARVATKPKTEIDAEVEAVPEGLELRLPGRQREIVPQLGQDAFIELFEKLRAREKMEAPGKRPEREKESLPEPSMDPDQFQREPPVERKRAKRGSIELTPGGDVVIRSFAGTHEDWFNVNLTKAAQHLANGQFYPASRRYELAIQLNPENPMARMGLCLSSFAAGEFRSAGLSLYRAMVLFAPIGETRLNIPLMMDEAVFARRLDLLEYQIQRADADVPALVYLTAVFMHRSAGQDFQAQEYARKLIESADGDELLLNYANFVLTGSRQPTTAPANQ